MSENALKVEYDSPEEKISKRCYIKRGERQPKPVKKTLRTRKALPKPGIHFEGREKWVNQDTGEMIDTVTAIHTVEDVNFQKVWFKYLASNLEIVGGKKIKVFNYIVDNLNYATNMLVATQEEIAKATMTSIRTVNDTINLLESTGLLKKRIGIIMLDPDVIVTGSASKRNYLLVKFETFDNESEKEQKKENPKRSRGNTSSVK